MSEVNKDSIIEGFAANLIRLGNECRDHAAENARLKALIIEMDKTINESQAGVRYLQSEVERLKNNCEYLDQKLDEEIDKSAMLCGQVELLTKYGDVLESGLRTLPGDFPRCLANEWTAAKEGKQS